MQLNTSRRRAKRGRMSPTSYNKKNSITVDKQVVEKTITFLTTNGTLEKKPNGDKNSFQIKDQAKLASDDIIDNTPAPPKILDTPTEAQVTDLLEESVNSNTKHTLQIEEKDLRDLTTIGKQINN